MSDKIEKSKVMGALACLDELLVQGQPASVRAYEILENGTVSTDGGSLDSHICFELARPERGLVRIKEQEASPSDPLGVVRRSTWVVTEFGEAVHVARRKRDRKAEIRAAVVREVSGS